MSSLVVIDWNLVVPNLDHPVLRGLMAGTFYSVCIVDVRSDHVCRRDYSTSTASCMMGWDCSHVIETTNKSAGFRLLVFD